MTKLTTFFNLQQKFVGIVIDFQTFQIIESVEVLKVSHPLQNWLPNFVFNVKMSIVF